MKRKKIILIILMVAFLSTACNKEEKIPIVNTNQKIHEHCVRNGILNDGTAELTYDIYYTGDVLNKIESSEKVISTNSNLLDQYEEAYKSIHEHYKNLAYYVTNVEREDGSVSSTIQIDYDKVDIAQLIAIEGEKDNIFENNIPKASKWKELANNIGTKCEIVS